MYQIIGQSAAEKGDNISSFCAADTYIHFLLMSIFILKDFWKSEIFKKKLSVCNRDANFIRSASDTLDRFEPW